jgi:hypothetical protein
MKKNLGNADRILRMIAAVAVGILYLSNVISGTVAFVLGLLAIIFLATSFVGLCPLYLLFGISTCKKEKAAHS